MDTVAASPSGSEQAGARKPSVSSSIVTLSAEQAGASLRGWIVAETVAAGLVADPSLARYVKLSEPFAFRAGE
jgi:hypothetical protein